MLAKLTMPTRDGRERVYPILDDKVYILGRGERVDIRVPDNSASRSHCIVEKKGDNFTLFDLTSANGTLLNGLRVQETTPIKTGDTIQIGETCMTFHVLAEAERYALMTEIPEEGEFDPLGPGKRFMGWRDPAAAPPDGSVIETPQDPAQETRAFDTAMGMPMVAEDVADRNEAAVEIRDEEPPKKPAPPKKPVAPKKPKIEIDINSLPEAPKEEDESDEGEQEEGAPDAETKVKEEEDEPAPTQRQMTPPKLELQSEDEADEEEEEEDESEEEPAPAGKKATGADAEFEFEDEAGEGGKKADPEEEAFSAHVVERGLLDEDKISLARMQREMDQSDKPLGLYLVERKLLTWEQLKELLAWQQGGFKKEAEKRWTKRENVLFGKLAVKKEFINAEQLQECLEEQGSAEDRKNIGEILVTKGFMTKNQVDAVLKAQAREVLRCTDCDAAYVVRNLEPGRRLKCKSCGAILTVPGATPDSKKLDELELPGE